MKIGAVYTADAMEQDAKPEALVEAALLDVARWFRNDPRASVVIGALVGAWCLRRGSG